VPALDPRLLRRARPARVLLGLDVAIGIGMALLVLGQATLFARIVARAVGGATLAELWVEAAILAALFTARGVLAWSFEVTGRRGASRVLSELRLELLERRLRRQPLALDGADGAEIAATAIQGVDSLEAYFARYLPQLVLSCVVPLAVLAWVAPIDLESALIMLLTLPLVPVFMWLIGSATERRTRERWQALRLLSTHFLDVVRGLPTLRAFNRGRVQVGKIAQVSERHRRATMATLRLSFLSGAVLELAATLGVALIAVTIGVRLVNGGIGLEAALTVLVLAPELYLPLRRLGAEYHASADGLAVAEEMLELLDTAPEAPEGGTLAPPSPAAAPVRFDGVSFSYPARPGPVLQGLRLELEPGETLALVGQSGAGKSTMAQLLLTLARPTAGRITVGGVDLAGADQRAWRRQIAWVPQRSTLLRDTLAGNIRLGDRLASDAEMRQAAASAGADAFIRALPDGYETIVGDGGQPLSAGETRRITLARAFLRDAPLVILDEPTADLDPASAELVGEAVERLCADRTVLLIAHRPELVRRADRVVVLVRGRAVPLRDREAVPA
jgi:ATP-binding cassette, subfamily C, bacterial CydD